MAVIGRSAAVAQVGRLQLHGWPAWAAWLFVHLINLVEFENRLLVLLQWGWNFISRNRSARLITERTNSDPGPHAADSVKPELRHRSENALSHTANA